MESYRRILRGIGIDNYDVWYNTWKVLTVWNIVTFLLFPLITIYFFHEIYTDRYSLTINYIFMLLPLIYYTFALYVYFKERKIDGWRMDTRVNSLISSSPIVVSMLIIIIISLFQYAITEESIIRVFFLILSVFLIAPICYTIYSMILGYKVEKMVKRIYNIPDLKKEVFKRLKNKFPEAKEKGKYMAIDGIRVEVINSNSSDSVGTVKIYGLRESNASKVRKIMKIVDVLG